MLSHIEQGSAPASSGSQPERAAMMAVASTPSCRWPASRPPRIAAMIAEAFSVPGERMPIAPLGVIGLVGAALASAALWNHNTSSFGVVAAGQLRAVRDRHPDRRRPAVAGAVGADHRPRAPAARRVLRAAAVRARRHDADGDRDGPAGHLPRARSALDRGLRADRHPARFARVHRGRVQVFPARRVLERVLPLRHRVRLRA